MKALFLGFVALIGAVCLGLLTWGLWLGEERGKAVVTGLVTLVALRAAYRLLWTDDPGDSWSDLVSAFSVFED